MTTYSNTKMSNAIDEFVHHPRYRVILRLKFCDNLTYEEIGEEVGYTPDHVGRLCRKYKKLLMSCL